jgi:cytochrome P450
MSDAQLLDEVRTLVLAGHETTANALGWAWYLLARHPEVEARLHAELAAVLGGRTPTLDDLPQLSYTRMVIDETMRLYPPAPIMGRWVEDEDELHGYRIQGKTFISFSQYAVHRHPDFWDDPERFDPERFTPERVAARPKYAYFPFGGGPRLCIGNNFALMEAQIILATLAQRYRLRLAADRPIEPELVLTLRPCGGVPVTLTPR